MKFNVILLFTFFTLNLFAQDGILDNTFSGDGKLISSLSNTDGKFIFEQSDGRIIACGVHRALEGATNVYKIFAQRFEQDGTLDNTYGTNGSFIFAFAANKHALFNAALLQTDDKLVISGTSSNFSDNTDLTSFVIRIDQNGALDNTFANNGILETEFLNLVPNISTIHRVNVSTITEQSNGDLLFGGNCLIENNGSNKKMFLFRLNSDGTFDSGFNNTGVLLLSWFAQTGVFLTVEKVEQLSNGKYIIFAQSAYFSQFYVFRYNQDGSPDTSFAPEGGKEFEDVDFPNLELLTAKVESNGKFFIVMQNPGNFTFIRLNSNGTYDNTYGTNGKVFYNDASISSGSSNMKSQFQTDGKILISDTYYGTRSEFNLFRFNYDGTIDLTFGNNGNRTVNFGTSYDAYAYNLFLQEDNNILLVGNGTDYTELAGRLTVARITSSCETPNMPNFNLSAPTLCSGVSTTVTLEEVSGAIIDNFTWSLPNGWSGTSVTNSINVTPNSQPGTISVVANNICGSSTPNSILIDLIAVPLAPSVISGLGNICSYTSNDYSIPAIPATSTCVWTLPNGWVGNSTSATITATANTNGGNISVREQNVCGTSPSTTLNVAVLSIPSAPTVINGNAIVCANITSNFSIATVATATSYTWTKPSGWSGVSTTESIDLTASNIGVGTITVKANNECGSSPITSMSVSSVQPMAAPASISGNQTICEGSSNTYTAATVNGATEYTWTLPNGWAGTSTSNSINIIAGSTSGNITVAANNECGAGNTKSFSISSIAIPQSPNSIVGDVSICRDSATTYSISAVSGATSYTWILPTNWNGSSTITSITTIAGNSGTISVSAENMCGSSQPTNIAVNVVDNPTNPVITKSGNTLFCDISAFDYQWYVNGFPIPGATNQTYLINGDGNYSVVVFNSLGCFAQSYFGYQVGIEENENSYFSLSPNPSDGIISILFRNELENGIIDVLDATGKLIYNFQNLKGTQVTLDLNLTDGVYFCRITEGQNSSIQKFIKY